MRLPVPKQNKLLNPLVGITRLNDIVGQANPDQLGLIFTTAMTNQIDILSPGKSCWKTRKMVRFLEKFVVQYGVNAEINLITDMKTMLTYRTWILPAVFVNGKSVARGYRPSKENIFKNLK